MSSEITSPSKVKGSCFFGITKKEEKKILVDTLGTFMLALIGSQNDSESTNREYLSSGKNKIALGKFSRLSPEKQLDLCIKINKKYSSLMMPKTSLQKELTRMAKLTGATKFQYCPAWEVMGQKIVPKDHSKKIEQITQQMLDNMRNVQERTKSIITAQGIESAKGGITNLINIMLEGGITRGCFGPLLPGNPNLCSGSHGPFYVVGDKLRIYAYIVPSNEHKIFIKNTLNTAVLKEIITKDHAQFLLSRTITTETMIEFSDEVLSDNEKFGEHVFEYNQNLSIVP